MTDVFDVRKLNPPIPWITRIKLFFVRSQKTYDLSDVYTDLTDKKDYGCELTFKELGGKTYIIDCKYFK